MGEGCSGPQRRRTRLGRDEGRQAVDEPRVEVSRDDRRVCQERAQERDVRVDAQQHGLGEGGVEPRERVGAVGAEGDDLRDHGVVVCGHDRAGLDRGIRPRIGRRRPREHGARRRQEPSLGTLGVDPRLDRMPREAHVRLTERQRRSGCDPHLLLDEVDARHEFGDGMLDLQPCVHLDEEELVGPVAGHEELDCSGAPIVDGCRGRAGSGAQAFPGRRVDDGRRRLLHDLLVSTLERALALAEVDDVPVGVGEHLHLDMARALDEPFEQQRVVAERGGRDATGRREGVGQVAG